MNTGIVHQDRDILAGLRCVGNILGIGNIELDGLKAGTGDVLRGKTSITAVASLSFGVVVAIPSRRGLKRAGILERFYCIRKK